MKAILLHLVLAGTAATFGAAPADAEEHRSWHRVESRSGDFNVEFPCAEADLIEKAEGGTSGSACFNSNIIFAALSTTDGMGGEFASPDFDSILAEAEADAEVARVEKLNAAGQRAFRIWGRADRPFAMSQISERGAGEVIVLAAMVDPEGAVDALDREAAEQDALRFFASLGNVAE